MTDVEPLAAADYDAPLWLQALTYPAGVDRDLIDAVFPTPGVIGAGDFAVTQRAAGANMTVDVAAGKIVVAGTDISLQGKYVGRMKNTVNVPIAAAPGAGLTRIDLVHAHVADATVIGSGPNALTVETPVTGTPASSNPAVPATPASSVPLARITVASGTAAITTAMIADVRPRAAAANPGPYILAGETIGVTDSFGNVSLNGIVPAGGKLISGIAQGAQVGYVHIYVRNNTDTPAGGNNCTWRVFTNTGATVSSATVGFAYIIAWTY